MLLLLITKKDPRKKKFKIFMDNVFNVDVAHSSVIGSKCFLTIATSVVFLLIPIYFRTQDCSVNCIFMLFLGFFSD